MCNLGRCSATRIGWNRGYSTDETNSVIRDLLMSTRKDRGNVRCCPRSPTKHPTIRCALGAFLAACLVLTMLAGCSPSKAGSPAITTRTVPTIPASPDRNLTANSATPESQQSSNGVNTHVPSTPSPDVERTQVSGSKAAPAAIESATSRALVKPTVATAGPTLLADQLRAQIAPLIAEAPAHIGIVIDLPDGSTLYQNEADTLFDAASLYKLGIMVEVYRQRDAGQLSFDDVVTLYPGYFLEDDSVYGYDFNVYDDIPVGTLLSNMITLSSNVAATALLDLVGTDSVNATMESLGLNNTKILWYPSAQADESIVTAVSKVIASNGPGTRFLSTKLTIADTTGGVNFVPGDAVDVTTPSDIARLFQELVNGTVISPQTSAEMLNLLADQQINDRLPAALPDGTRVAHKTGDLDNSVHDAGIIFAPDSPIVVVVMSDEVENREAIVALIQQIALLTFQAESF